MTTQNKSAVEKLEEGKRRLVSLTDRRTRLQVELEAARRQLKEAQLEAELEFGTSDLNALRNLFKEREEQNNAAVEAFLESLSDLESALKKTEQALNS